MAAEPQNWKLLHLVDLRGGGAVEVARAHHRHASGRSARRRGDGGDVGLQQPRGDEAVQQRFVRGLSLHARVVLATEGHVGVRGAHDDVPARRDVAEAHLQKKQWVSTSNAHYIRRKKVKSNESTHVQILIPRSSAWASITAIGLTHGDARKTTGVPNHGRACECRCRS